MFTRKEKYQHKLKESIIGEDSTYHGKVHSVSTIRIEGKFTGDIQCENDVIIGEKSSLHSNISARDVIIAGKVNGDIRIKGKLVLLQTGEFHGNIEASAIIIHEGGIFHGTSTIKSDKSQQQENEGKYKKNAMEDKSQVRSENEGNDYLTQSISKS